MKWLENLPSHNFQVANAAGLTWATAGAIFWSEWHEKHIEELVLIPWLTFLAALWGVSYKYFAKKRDTFDANAVPTTEKVHAREEAKDAGVVPRPAREPRNEGGEVGEHEEVPASSEQPSPEVRRAIF